MKKNEKVVKIILLILLVAMERSLYSSDSVSNSVDEAAATELESQLSLSSDIATLSVLARRSN